MLQRAQTIITILKNYKKVIENYFFMTLLFILNSLFGLLLYPLVIGALGKDSYGTYVFVMSVVQYFITFVSFGFDSLGVREISLNINNVRKKSKAFSAIFTSKLYLELVSLLVFMTLIATIPVLRAEFTIYLIAFLGTVANILLPSWYFQAIQKMRVITYVQVVIKMLSIVLIWRYVKVPSDLTLFTFIMTSSTVAGAAIAFVYLLKQEKLRVKIVSVARVKQYIMKARYFFYTSVGVVVKLQTLNIITGLYFSMADLAIYDLAYKVIMIPMAILVSINGALFPKIMIDFNLQAVKKILTIESAIAIIACLITILLSPYVIALLGKGQMEDAFPLVVIMSFSLYGFLLAGCYCSLILVPMGLDKYILNNQIVAMVSVFVVLFLGLLITDNILTLAVSFTLSSVAEVFYLRYIIQKKVNVKIL
ncbi:oligosaccharide flippase family protein [Capnocytophaga sp.]|uniref:oligosaccharide flippase family protein n=1 Tax=Capnocytophaga sp. TaxID=44737 RepID=UPI0026DD716D|nr:oligosaccharide flippase family protein [Capnocytophaga sp.]MDO5104294.1 oligosaccharide flippase family protein [Capnocytophaga sp.]